jgi:hypothetical protein
MPLLWFHALSALVAIQPLWRPAPDELEPGSA